MARRWSPEYRLPTGGAILELRDVKNYVKSRTEDCGEEGGALKKMVRP